MLEFLLGFIKTNFYDIIVILIGLSVLGFLWYIGKKELVFKVVYGLVCKAEKLFGSGTGELKYAYVVAEIYKRLPFIVTIFLTRRQLDSYIESSVQKLKEFLKNGNLLGYDDEIYHDVIYLSDDEADHIMQTRELERSDV